MEPLAVTTLGILEQAKKKTGFLLPTDFVDAFEDVASRVGGKEKWQVICAAILLLLESPPDVQNQYIQAIRKAAGPGESFEKLIAEARAVADRGGVKKIVLSGAYKTKRNHPPARRQ